MSELLFEILIKSLFEHCHTIIDIGKDKKQGTNSKSMNAGIFNKRCILEVSRL